jgi:hypothetical protein
MGNSISETKQINTQRSNPCIVLVLLGGEVGGDAAIGPQQRRAARDTHSHHGSQQRDVELVKIGRGYCWCDEEGLQQADDGVCDAGDGEKTAMRFESMGWEGGEGVTLRSKEKESDAPAVIGIAKHCSDCRIVPGPRVTTIHPGDGVAHHENRICRVDE